VALVYGKAREDAREGSLVRVGVLDRLGRFYLEASIRRRFGWDTETEFAFRVERDIIVMAPRESLRRSAIGAVGRMEPSFRISVPSAMRRLVGLAPGEPVAFEVLDSGVILLRRGPVPTRVAGASLG